MQAERLLTFGPYRFDPHTGQLWRGKQEVRLTGKAVAVLRYLVERATQVVTKDEVFQAVWSDTVVSDAALSSCIQEVRQALHDNAKKPRYIETVHRRGFQFIGKVVSDQFSVVSQDKGVSSQHSVVSSSPPPTQHSVLSPQHAVLVGREAELTQLYGWLAKALNGERQIVFVTGEPGIGKTTLVDAFGLGVRSQGLGVGSPPSPQPQPAPVFSSFLTPNPQSLTPGERLWWGRGQCIEHYGSGEAYLPILEAWGRLCRETDGQRLIDMLKQHAPAWLVQMPALLNAAELETLQRKTQGATRERMLRELAEALEVITAERLLVLVLEDLHWSDVSTLDLLSMLARRNEPARLLIIGTYRPVEVLTHDHPLKGIKQELQLHEHCQELALDFLSEGDVAAYLEARFAVGARHAVPLQALAHHLHQRTDGNPLFMVTVTNELVKRGIIVEREGHWEIRGKLPDEHLGAPENLRQLIEQQIERVGAEERKVLEAASVAGAKFSAATVAAGTDKTVEEVEQCGDDLVRREQFLRTRGTSEWPDGTIAARYGFVHALYQEVLYEQISASRRVRLHRQIGEREEAGYGNQAREIAAELAVHFERGRDYDRAVQYLQHAGENASQRNAYIEAISLLTKGLELLDTLPDTTERAQQELTLQIALGGPLMATKGYAAPEAERAYARARELCQQVRETPQLFPALYGLFSFALVRAEYRTAHELAEQLLRLAQSMQAPALLVEAHCLLGHPLFFLGEFSPACEHFEQGLALYNSQKHNPYVSGFPQDPGVVCLSFIGWILWLRGYPDQALQRIQEALTLARELAHPFSVAYALLMAARLHLFRQEVQAAQEQAEILIKLCAEQGFGQRMAQGTIFRNWAVAMQGQGETGITQLHEGITAFRATGAEINQSHHLALLAEAYGEMEQTEEGLAVLAEALTFVDKTGEPVYEAELYRLTGELTLQQESQRSKVKTQKSKVTDPRPLTRDPQGEAEACFLKAIEVSQKQQAKSLELRATMSLAHLWRSQGKTKQAHNKLSEIYNWFTEGFDTKDLQEAKALLKELAEG